MDKLAGMTQAEQDLAAVGYRHALMSSMSDCLGGLAAMTHFPTIDEDRVQSWYADNRVLNQNSRICTNTHNTRCAAGESCSEQCMRKVCREV